MNEAALRAAIMQMLQQKARSTGMSQQRMGTVANQIGASPEQSSGEWGTADPTQLAQLWQRFDPSTAKRGVLAQLQSVADGTSGKTGDSRYMRNAQLAIQRLMGPSDKTMRESRRKDLQMELEMQREAQRNPYKSIGGGMFEAGYREEELEQEPEYALLDPYRKARERTIDAIKQYTDMESPHLFSSLGKYK